MFGSPQDFHVVINQKKNSKKNSFDCHTFLSTCLLNNAF